MTDPLTIVVPGTPPRELSPNARVHHMLRHRVGQDFKRLAYYAAYDQLIHAPYRVNDAPINVSLCISWEKGRKRNDQDNAIASCKRLLDGVSYALGVDDARFVIKGVEQLRDPAGRGQTTVTLWQDEEDAA